MNTETSSMETKTGGESCPSCGKRGRSVKPVTIASLVTEAARAAAGHGDGFRFCAEPSCDVAYFHPETGNRIQRGNVKVRIGQKETAAPRPFAIASTTRSRKSRRAWSAPEPPASR